MKRQKCRTGMRRERASWGLLSAARRSPCQQRRSPCQQRRGTRHRGTNSTTSSRMAPHFYCIWIFIIIIIVGGEYVPAADAMTLDLSATRLVDWRCARAAPVCAVEASTLTCSVTETVPSYWPPSQPSDTALSHTCPGGLGVFR